MKPKSIKTHSVTVTKTDEGYHLVEPRTPEEQTAEDAAENLKKIRAAFGEEKKFVLIDSRAMGTLSREARETYSTNSNIHALALLVDSTFTRITANLFIQVARPKFPVRMFTSQKDAVDWLKEQMLAV